jgi:hypothetical protein
MKLIEHSSGHWNKNVNPCWGITSSFDTVMRQLEIADVDLLPDLSSSPSLILTSDYGGQHKGATHEAFSFLTADLARCGAWNKERQRVRDTFFTEKRRMSYKALNDHQRRSALLPFLSAADRVPGLLTTVLVNKRVGRSLKLTTEEREQLPPTIAKWPIHVLQKLTFVAHLGALLIAGLSSAGQNILWFTDNDDFGANDRRVIDLTPRFAGIISGYVGHELGHFRLGTMQCDAGDLQIEDLTAIPDLVSGAACEIPLDKAILTQTAIKVPLRGHISPKALAILHWMGQRHMPLKRLIILIDEGDFPRAIKVKALELSSDSLNELAFS